MKRQGKVFIGTSGYNYFHWKDVFYPEDLPQKNWLEYYCKYFNTVELNVTFYRLLQENAFKSWFKRTPEDFHFVVKGSRFITHIKRLKDVDAPLSLFRGRIKFLKEKLSVILWQLPPKFKVDENRLTSFIRSLKEIIPDARHSIEFRNETWLNENVADILTQNNISLCHADHPVLNVNGPVTSDFVYIRRHGPAGLYRGCYSGEELKKDKELINDFRSRGIDVYIFFNNDAGGYAVKNAIDIKKMLSD